MSSIGIGTSSALERDECAEDIPLTRPGGGPAVGRRGGFVGRRGGGVGGVLKSPDEPIKDPNLLRVVFCIRLWTRVKCLPK